MAMAVAPPNSTTILETHQVAPATNSAVSATELSFPITFFDALFIRFPPGERVYFYKLNSSPTFFHSEIIPSLINSLSLTLLHFLPFAGNLKWPLHSPSPIILFSPNDTVLLKVAESNADFDHLTGDKILEVDEFRPYLPELLMSDKMASIISLQITLFPNKGFSIGIAINHTVLDGKSTSMFLKAWAYTCRNMKNTENSTPLSSELIPSFDRTNIKDPDELLSFYLNQDSKSNARTLNMSPNVAEKANNDLVRATFQLSNERIYKIREEISSYYLQKDHQAMKDVRFSTLVIAFAYISVCQVKARGGDSERKVYCFIPVDCRSRLELVDPPIPQNYIGNCLYILDIHEKAGTFMEKNGVAIITKKLSDSIKGLMERKRSSISEGVKERHERMRSENVQKIGIAGSPRFAYYEEDFGWGNPEKVEIASIKRANGVSFKESRDGSGGIEIGLVLPRLEMETFASHFLQM